MLGMVWGSIFLAVAIVAAILGFWKAAGIYATVATVFFGIFVALSGVSFLMGHQRRKQNHSDG